MIFPNPSAYLSSLQGLDINNVETESIQNDSLAYDYLILKSFQNECSGLRQHIFGVREKKYRFSNFTLVVNINLLYGVFYQIKFDVENCAIAVRRKMSLLISSENSINNSLSMLCYSTFNTQKNLAILTATLKLIFTNLNPFDNHVQIQKNQ